MVKQIGPTSFLKSAQRKLCLAIGLLMFWAQADAPAFAQTGATAAAQAAQDAIPLEPGKPISRELAGGQSHPYQITLDAGQYLNVVVEQRGIDVVVALFGPDGKQIAEFDSEIRKQGQEIVLQVAEATGSYQLSVQARQKDAPAGSYEIRVVELRVATEKDRALQEARKLSAEFVRLYRAGEFDEARPLVERALEIREKELGSEHPDVAASLNNLAILHSEKGNYAKAEPLFQRALDIREKALVPDHLGIAGSLSNLAILYWNKGDFAKAELLHQRALAIREKALGPDHPIVAVSLNNLAILYNDIGDYTRAEPLHGRALAIREKTLGPDHPSVAMSLNNLAFLYNAKGDFAKAEPLHQRALAINEKALGPEHPSVTYPLNGLANLYRAKGDYAKAESLYQRALAINEKTLGPEHPDVALFLNNLARLCAAKDDVTQAVAFQLRASAVRERNLSLNLATGSERQKIAYLATLSAQTDEIISLHVHAAPTDRAARDLAAATILQRKGRGLDAMTDSLAALRSRLNAQDRELLDRLRSTLSQLARLVLNGPEQITPVEHQSRIKSLDEEVEKLQAGISQRSAEFRAQSQPVTLEAIQAAIPAEAALVEFLVYRPHNAKYTKQDEEFGAPRYVAYILRQQGAAEWVELGEAKAIDGAIEAWRRALRDPKRRDSPRLARAADRLVMQPVRAHLGATRRVLLSPDGALNLIPFAALVDERSRFLVERYEFSYVTSGRDLLRLQVKQPGRQPALIVANPNYGEMATGESLKTKPESKTFTTLSFRSLPATADEARALKKTLPTATILLGDQATEAAVKQAHGPALLHVATHGFFLPGLTPPATTRRRGLDGEIASGNLPSENPLLLSGLALAGANLRHNGDEDGVLTALEATALDLWGTKLVVLSACDTGLGEVKNGEGVYGLRRALVLAGSESQVMSLWPVSDEGTLDLMSNYYRALQQGRGRSAALRQVQLRMLKSRDRRHPFYWAGFIQSGEWANLQGRR